MIKKSLNIEAQEFIKPSFNQNFKIIKNNEKLDFEQSFDQFKTIYKKISAIHKNVLILKR